MGWEGTGDGQFLEPRGMSSFGDEIFICDRIRSNIQVFSTHNGRFLRSFDVGTLLPNRNFNSTLMSIAVDADGMMVVDFDIDEFNTAIRVFNRDEKYVQSWNLEEKEVSSIHLHGGRLHVVLPGSIEVYDRTVRPQKAKDSVVRPLRTYRLGEDYNASGCCIEGSIMYVACPGRRCVLALSIDTGRIAFRRRTYEGPGENFNPKAVAVYADELFVTDRKNDRVVVIDRDTGEVKNTFRGSLSQGRLDRPRCVVVDGDRLFVSDRLYVYKFQ